MGWISRLLSWTRTEEGDAHVSDVKVDPGGGANVTAHHFGPPGDDSVPLRGDYVATSSSTGAGNQHVTGYIDPDNEGQATAGEKRLYSRNSDGAVMAVVWLKSDGTVEVGANATEFAAIARLVLEELQAVKSDLDSFKSTFDAHTHATSATIGTGGIGALDAPVVGFPAPHDPASVASETVKLEP